MASKTDLAVELETVREAVREAHGVLKDLRAAAREARALVPDLVKGQLEAAVADGLAGYADTIRKAQDEAVDRVNATFDELADLLMGRDEESRREGKPDVPTLVERLVGGNGGGNTVADPRRLGGDITGGGGPHDRNTVAFDTEGAVLLEHAEVAVAHAADDDDVVALLLSGKVNGSRDRAKVLFLADADGAAAVVTELEALMRRAGAGWLDRYRVAKAERVAKLKASGSWE